VLYPSNLLYLVLPLYFAFNLDIVGHIILAGVFTYLLSRKLRLTPVSSFIAGTIYCFCGFTLSLANLLNWLIAMAYLPLVLLFWHLYMHEEKRAWFVGASIAGALQILGGAPEVAIVTMLTLFGWTFSFPYEISPGKKLARMLFLWIAIGGLSAVQLIPAFEM